MYNLRYYKEQQKKYDAVLNSLNIFDACLVLDVGCGTGLFIRRIADYSGTIIGVDASRKMLDEVVKTRNPLTDVSLICGDADFLPVRDNVFNRVFAFTLLQNMPHPEQTIREILRVAAIDSIVVLTAQKKSFTKERFMSMLENLDLCISSFLDDSELKDCIVICGKPRN